MRSRALRIIDYRDVPLEIVPFQADKEALEQELQRLANPYIQWKEGDTVSPGDLAVCKLQSDCPRFHKEAVRFIAGSGMFQREVEMAAVGLSVGETTSVHLAEGVVTITLHSVQNRVVPSLTDEMVQALDLEGVHTLEDYRQYLLDAQRDKAFNNASYALLGQLFQAVCHGSEFVLCKEDWKTAVNLELNRCRALSKREGLVLEEMTPQEFEGRIPVQSYDELVIMVQESAWDSLYRYLLGRYYAEQDGFSVDEAGYQAYVEQTCQETGESPEQVKEVHPWQLYEFNAYCTHTYQVWTEYLKQVYQAADKTR